MLQAASPESPLRPGGSAGTARLRSLSFSSAIIGVDHPQPETRRRVERFVEAAYARAYGARIDDHYPTLISVEDAAGVIQAVAGFRSADDGPLFLEHYLGAPVEDALSAALSETVPRTRVCEIGNFTSRAPAATLFLFRALARRFKSAGQDLAVGTLTQRLRTIVEKVGVNTIELTSADPARLPDQGVSWGSYYLTNPRVLVGAIPGHLAEDAEQGLQSRHAVQGPRS